jgi:hypothetical protein
VPAPGAASVNAAVDYIAILNSRRGSVYLCKCKVNQHAARARLPKLCARLESALSAKCCSFLWKIQLSGARSLRNHSRWMFINKRCIKCTSHSASYFCCYVLSKFHNDTTVFYFHVGANLIYFASTHKKG